jgi:hypothetical protein
MHDRRRRTVSLALAGLAADLVNDVVAGRLSRNRATGRFTGAYSLAVRVTRGGSRDWDEIDDVLKRWWTVFSGMEALGIGQERYG